MQKQEDVEIVNSKDGYRIAATIFEIRPQEQHEEQGSGGATKLRKASKQHNHIATIIVSPAMATKRQFYSKFASFMSKEGNLRVITFDFRGNGERFAEIVKRQPYNITSPLLASGIRDRSRSFESDNDMREFNADLTQWGTDLASVIQYASAKYPTDKIIVVGHSIGGQLIGLVGKENASKLVGMVCVAAQVGYWGLWPFPGNLRLFLSWYLIVPIVTRCVRNDLTLL
eukprot:GEZU01025442.1.p1 GENE.GEZU01025442.1~~GEZU01025442.1.p1  ORF type:complete len:228 (-),score=46.42 GEZU01025442.1:68-751(-)